MLATRMPRRTACRHGRRVMPEKGPGRSRPSQGRPQRRRGQPSQGHCMCQGKGQGGAPSIRRQLTHPKQKPAMLLRGTGDGGEGREAGQGAGRE
jgi:hypothetical protein